MHTMKSTFLFIAFLCATLTPICKAQNIAMHEWSSILPYNQAFCADETDEYIFVGTSSGIFRTAKSDHSIRRFGKEDGMADFNVAAIGYSSSANALIIGYKNGNIDVMVDNQFYNLPELYNSGSVSNKEIHSVTIKQNLAYVCAGFGISIIDLKSRKFKSTAKFQPAGQPEFAVYDITFKNNLIYAATAKGLFEYNDINLFEDFGSWQLVSGLPNGHYSFVEYFANTLYTVFSQSLTSALDDMDTLFYSNGSNFSSFNEVEAHTVKGLRAHRNKLCISYKNSSSNGKILVKDVSNATIVQTSHFFFSNPHTGLYAANNKTYIPDGYFGLIAITPTGNFENIQPVGPFSNLSRKIIANDNQITLISGGFSTNFGPGYISDGLFFRKDNNWSYQNHLNQPLMNATVDFVALEKDPKNPQTFYAGSLVGGLYKFVDGICTDSFKYANTGGAIGTSTNTKVTYLKADKNGSLFIAHNGINPIQILKTDGTFIPFQIPGLTSSDIVTSILPINDEIIWISTYGKGIIAVKHENYSPVNIRFLNTNVGNGKLTSMYVSTLALDKDGEVWTGTNNGFSIFYNPHSVFTSGVNIDSSQPIVKADDGNNEPMLKGANIMGVTVDGGNRKWYTTMGSGVTLLSDDGFIIEKSFTKSNSPILSDNVYNADIDPNTGLVYFSTESGISIYRSDATEAEDNFGDVYSFPNPVRPGYAGLVTITGLAENSEVKITDTNGQLVYETIANGGTATWNLYGFNGIKARSGVYLVFANGSEKKAKHVTKILVMQ